MLVGYMIAVTHCVFQFVLSLEMKFSAADCEEGFANDRWRNPSLAAAPSLKWLECRSRNDPQHNLILFSNCLIKTFILHIMVKRTVLFEARNLEALAWMGLELGIGMSSAGGGRWSQVLQHWLLWPGLHLLRLGLAAQAAS